VSYNKSKNHRRSIRLPDYDYSSEGLYYVTICTQDRLCLFGEVIGGQMTLNACGEIVKQELLRTPEIRREITLDEWVIMPNHIHAIVAINETEHDTATGHAVGATGHVGAHGHAPLRERRFVRKPKSLSSFIAGFKSAVTVHINQLRQTPGNPVWQRNYWEHIIRNGESYDKIKRYVIENPMNWTHDEENPHKTKTKN
jgi:REP element-mobilizing transposase RayT